MGGCDDYYLHFPDEAQTGSVTCSRSPSLQVRRARIQTRAGAVLPRLEPRPPLSGACTAATAAPMAPLALIPLDSELMMRQIWFPGMWSCKRSLETWPSTFACIWLPAHGCFCSLKSAQSLKCAFPADLKLQLLFILPKSTLGLGVLLARGLPPPFPLE